MPILDIQRQFREIGRLRAGMKAHGTRKDGSTYTYPTRIDTWRFTSHNADILYRVADTYGGTVNPWDDQHEVVTTTDTVDVLVPGGVPISQWWEWWQGGTCERRCDGQRLTDDRPCLCAPEVEAGEDRKCSPTTRLSVFLPDVPDIGTWRVDTGSFYAARELGALWSLIERAQPGDLIPAKLRIDPREDRVRDDKGKVLVKKYNVVVVEFPEASIAELTRGLRPALDSPSRPELPAGPPPPAEVPAWQDDEGVAGQLGGNSPAPIPDAVEGPRQTLDDPSDQAVGAVVASSPTQAPAPAAAASRMCRIPDHGCHEVASVCCTECTVSDAGVAPPSAPPSDTQPGEDSPPPPSGPPRAAPPTGPDAARHAAEAMVLDPLPLGPLDGWTDETRNYINDLGEAMVRAKLWVAPGPTPGWQGVKIDWIRRWANAEGVEVSQTPSQSGFSSLSAAQKKGLAERWRKKAAADLGVDLPPEEGAE